jgi:hypothetical protein
MSCIRHKEVKREERFYMFTWNASEKGGINWSIMMEDRELPIAHRINNN